MPIIMMHPLFWFVWLAIMLRGPRRRPVLRVIEGGGERGTPRPLKRRAIRQVQ